jgi:hypothetical protein
VKQSQHAQSREVLDNVEQPMEGFRQSRFWHILAL